LAVLELDVDGAGVAAGVVVVGEVVVDGVEVAAGAVAAGDGLVVCCA
jgi:hypothetical protein